MISSNKRFLKKIQSLFVCVFFVKRNFLYMGIESKVLVKGIFLDLDESTVPLGDTKHMVIFPSLICNYFIIHAMYCILFVFIVYTYV